MGLCVPYIFMDPTKLHRGATPPSLMVLFIKEIYYIKTKVALLEIASRNPDLFPT